MKNIVRLSFVALFMMGVTISGKAHVWVGDGTPAKGTQELRQTTAGCAPSSGFEWLNINNVRTRYNAGGDMWWDLPGGMGAQYYIPANGSATSLFAGALWIAGRDVNDQLKCSAVRFRQAPDGKGGNDFWTGPLTLDGANIDALTCAQWDRIWKINRTEVDEFINHLTGPKPNAKARYGTYEPTEGYEIPQIIQKWPAHPDDIGGSGVSHYMAPFYDNDENGEYEPEMGDFPYYDIENELCHTKSPTWEEVWKDVYPSNVYGSILSDQVLKGDQTLWWVFNDKGNSHTESHGEAIGLEIRAQAFGFSTNDEINNMSFCSYEIINRSTYTLTKTYFCPWTDVDLGYSRDDYVGCDVQRGLGYGYNGYAIDGNGEPEAYGNQPPAVGVDFFQGPYMDADEKDNPKYSFTYNYNIYTVTSTGDTLYQKTDSTQLCDESINGVNFGNGIVDDERFGMRRFLYHTNGAALTGDPEYASDYYNFLQGIWKNGLPMMYGGNAYPTDANCVGPQCVFMFPGDTDPCNWGTNGIAPGGGYNTNGKYWTDAEAGNSPDDRRFMQSAGPFTLYPGAVNYITFGVPWARATSGGPQASVELLRVTDDKCQALFDNCFKVLDGPNAPDLTIRELDQKLIIYISNSSSSNNFREGYNEKDERIPEHIPGTESAADRHYRFEGYKVYQLIDDQVAPSELYNTAKARLIFQCDVQNGVTSLVNYDWDDHIGANVPSLKVEGGDAGITHSFVVTEDQFSTSESTALVNHKTYYFMAVAYAYNNYMTYAQDPQNPILLNGQKEPYLEGRKNIKCYDAVPHKIINGTVIQAEYGQKPSITRMVGMGNGGNEIELVKECIDTLFMEGEKLLANSTIIENGDTVKVTFGHPKYPVIYHPTYKVGYGPIDVKIIDPLNVKSTAYELWFDTLTEVTFYNVSSNSSVNLQVANNKYTPGSKASKMASHWYLKDLLDEDEEHNTEKSDTLNVFNGEQVFLDKGISVSINQPWNIGPYEVGWLYDNSPTNPGWYVAKEVLAPNSGMITSSLTFQDSTHKWLDGIRDKDIPDSPLNWIRAGKYYDNSNADNNDFDMSSAMTSYDPNEAFEKIANRTWAPYAICAYMPNTAAPVATNAARRPESFSKISSVDIVLTGDTSKWTRCPVVEACPDAALAENEVRQFALRKSASVDKKGRPYIDPETGLPWAKWDSVGIDSIYMYASDDPDAPNFIAPQGMSWFPGYAIDIETGARLNIIFSEDSYLVDLNGRDMWFNPPALLKNTVDELYGDQSQLYDPAIFRQLDQEAVFGGKHYVYVLGTGPTQLNSTPQFPAEELVTPAYDGGHYAFNLLYRFQVKSTWQTIYRSHLWRQVMYVGMPMPVEGQPWLPQGNDAKIRIRVSKPYDRGYSYLPVDTTYLNDPKYNLNYNNLYPMYRFSIEGLDAVPNDPAKTVEDLNLVNVVPNPYYAFSGYEANALVNKVKITNLPDKCTVTIYNLSGTKIRQFKKDNDVPSIDWDLTNFANTPVASGFYLIHVKDNTSGGERTIKFFGAMRLIDLNTF